MREYVHWKHTFALRYGAQKSCKESPQTSDGLPQYYVKFPVLFMSGREDVGAVDQMIKSHIISVDSKS